VFPTVDAVPGIYRFTVTDGTQVNAGELRAEDGGQAPVSACRLCVATEVR